MSAVVFGGLPKPEVLKETGPALPDQARIHPRLHVPRQSLPRPLNSTGFSIQTTICGANNPAGAAKSWRAWEANPASSIIPLFHHSIHPASDQI